jgi:hypothetical protein
MVGVPWKLRLVRALNTACRAVDDVAYRPAVVRLTMPLPRWWNCELAHLSMRLDDHWGTGYWKGDIAPAAPVTRLRMLSAQKRVACHGRVG